MIALRILYSAFVSAVLLFAVVAIMLVSGEKSPPAAQPVTLPMVLLGIGVIALVVEMKVERPLDGSSEQALARSYRSRLVIRSAIAELATFMGIIGYIMTANWWVIAAGVLLGAFGYVRAAPTRQALQRDQEWLQEQGSLLSLTPVLRAVPGTNAR